MRTLKVVLAGIWGFCLGLAAAQFAFAGNWAMVSLIAGLVVMMIYLVIWMIDLRYGGEINDRRQ